MTPVRPGARATASSGLPAPQLTLLLRCALAALLVLWLPLALLQEVDALLAYTAPRDIARDFALLVLLAAVLAGILALLAWGSGVAARQFGRSVTAQVRIAWALLLVPAGWLCAWQITRSVRLWLQMTSGVTFGVGPHTRLIGIVLLLGLVLVLWGRFGTRRLGHLAVALLLSLSAPGLLLLGAGLMVTLWMPPLLLSSPAAGGRGAAATGIGGHPDVILISIDALAAADAGVCGSGPTLMPRLRALASQSSCFARAYAGGNFTTPATSTMETGVLPWTHFATQIGAAVLPPLRESTLAGRLRSAGYHTSFMTDNFQASPLHHGTWRTWDDQRSAASLMQNRLQQAFTIFPDTALPLLTANLLSFVGALDVYLYGSRNPYDPMRSYREVPGMLAATAGPQFVWIHTMPPHAPYLPPASTRHRLLPPGELERWDEFLPENTPYGDAEQPLVDRIRARYRESIMGADESLGRLLDELQRLGRLQGALLIVTADHGESFEHGFLGHAGPLLYDPLVRIPLVVKLPGQRVGRIVEQPVSQADLVPTVLDLVGAAPLPSLEGRSLRAALEDGKLDPVPVFTMSMERQSRFRPLRLGHYAVIDGWDKLIWDLGEGSIELYDTRADPHEHTNLARAEPALVAHLQQLLRTRLDAAETARKAWLAR